MGGSLFLLYSKGSNAHALRVDDAHFVVGVMIGTLERSSCRAVCVRRRENYIALLSIYSFVDVDRSIGGRCGRGVDSAGGGDPKSAWQTQYSVRDVSHRRGLEGHPEQDQV
jgi:hypothetical protein